MPHSVGDLPIWLWWISILVTPTVSLLGVATSLWLTRDRQVRDRAWAVKQTAYANILSAINAALATLALIDHRRMESGVSYFSSARGRDDLAAVRAWLRGMAQAYRGAALVLPPTFVEAYAGFIIEVVSASNKEPGEEFASLRAAVPRAQARFASLARADLDLGAISRRVTGAPCPRRVSGSAAGPVTHQISAPGLRYQIRGMG